jgi:effector-binding domain-containing protein
MRLSLISLALVLLTCGIVLAGPTTKPVNPKDAGDDFVVSKMRVQEFNPKTYLYAETQTTLAQIGPVVTDLIGKLKETMKDGKVQPAGPMIFVYQGATHDPNQQFTLQVGFPVAPETKDIGNFKVRQLEKFRAATVLFSGAIANVSSAYQQVFTDLYGANLQPTGETREYYLYWEAPESVNNVQLIQVGIKE